MFLQDDDIASVSNKGHLSIHRIKHPEKDPLTLEEGESQIRDFASTIKEAKRRKINKIQLTMDEVNIIYTF